MNWFAIRRSQPSRLRNQTRTLGGIPHDPPHPRQLVPKLIGPRKVPRRPSLLPLPHQLQSPLVALGTFLGLGRGAETDKLEHLPHRLSSRILRNLPPVRFPDQLKDLGESP